MIELLTHLVITILVKFGVMKSKLQYKNESFWFFSSFSRE